MMEKSCYEFIMREGAGEGYGHFFFFYNELVIFLVSEIISISRNGKRFSFQILVYFPSSFYILVSLSRIIGSQPCSAVRT